MMVLPCWSTTFLRFQTLKASIAIIKRVRGRTMHNTVCLAMSPWKFSCTIEWVSPRAATVDESRGAGKIWKHYSLQRNNQYQSWIAPIPLRASICPQLMLCEPFHAMPSRQQGRSLAGSPLHLGQGHCWVSAEWLWRIPTISTSLSKSIIITYRFKHESCSIQMFHTDWFPTEFHVYRGIHINIAATPSTKAGEDCHFVGVNILAKHWCLKMLGPFHLWAKQKSIRLPGNNFILHINKHF